MQRLAVAALLSVAAGAFAGCGADDAARRAATPPHLGRTFTFAPARPAPRVHAQIAYASGPADTSRGTTLRIVDLVTGRDREIARLRGAQGYTSGFGDPAWSPDGRWLAVTSSQARRRPGGTGARYEEWVIGTWVVDVDGGGLRRLTGSRYVSATPGTSVVPQWTPDGSAVIVRGSRGVALLPVARDGRATDRGVADAEYAPDGRHAIMRAGFGVWIADLPSRRLRRVVADGEQAAWSPDGRRIVFVSSRDHNGDVGQGSDEDAAEGAADEVYVADASGRRPRRVTHTRLSEYVPRWSPDGRLILFDATGDGGEILSDDTSALQVIRPDGRCLTALPDPSSANLVPGGGYAWRPGSDTRGVRLRCR